MNVTTFTFLFILLAFSPHCSSRSVRGLTSRLTEKSDTHKKKNHQKQNDNKKIRRKDLLRSKVMNQLQRETKLSKKLKQLKDKGPGKATKLANKLHDLRQKKKMARKALRRSKNPHTTLLAAASGVETTLELASSLRVKEKLHGKSTVAEAGLEVASSQRNFLHDKPIIDRLGEGLNAAQKTGNAVKDSSVLEVEKVHQIMEDKDATKAQQIETSAKFEETSKEEGVNAAKQTTGERGKSQTTGEKSALEVEEAKEIHSTTEGNKATKAKQEAKSAKVEGDPRFYGFDDSRYDFEGEPGIVYNIITDRKFQLNARFVEAPHTDRSYMGVLGIKIEGNDITVDPDFLMVNNELLQEGQFMVLYNAQDDWGKECGTIYREAGEIRVKSQSFQLDISIVHLKWFRYFNVGASVETDHLSNPHGLLGQTARFMLTGEKSIPKPAGTFPLQGVAADYVVNDGPLGTEFAQNRYNVNWIKPIKRNSDAPKAQWNEGKVVYKPDLSRDSERALASAEKAAEDFTMM